MGFQQLRLWGRGRKNGWGANGELQLFVKMGRDADNFYLYRTPINSGTTADAWNPEIQVDFNRLFQLRVQLQNDYLQGRTQSSSCTGVDSALVASSPVPAGGRRYAVCSDGYMVYTVDPAATPPNLNAVQEMAVGIVRVGVGVGAGATLPGDTLELWVDDVRLSQVVNSAGYAGEIGADISLSNLADFHLNMMQRDPHFRQLGEDPTFLDERELSMASTIHLDKLLPPQLGLSLPMTIIRTSSGADPLFLQNTDVLGAGIDGLRTPRATSTAYTLSVRRTVPLRGGLVEKLANHLSATSSYVDGESRSEYNDGTNRNAAVSLDYTLVNSTAQVASLPSWVDGVLGAIPAALQGGPISTLRSTAFRLNPSLVRLTSGIVRGTERQFAYLDPGGTLESTPVATVDLTNLWHNSALLELRPTANLTLQVNASLVHDLRQYGDTNASAIAASNSRSSVFGTDIGLERERDVLSQMIFAPVFSGWFRPRLEFGSQYSMVRDPNVVGVGVGVGGTANLTGIAVIDSAVWHDTTATGTVAPATNVAALFAPPRPTLPRRLLASQTLSLGATIDPGRAFLSSLRDTVLARHLASVLLPITVRYDRSLLSAFDAAGASPGIGFQFGLAGADAFRGLRGVAANTSGITGTWSASGSLQFPFGILFKNDYRVTTTHDWVRRLDSSDSTAVDEANGEQVMFPSSLLRWTFRPAATGETVEGITASAGYTQSRASISLPTADGSPPELRRSRVEATPFSGSVSWGFGHLTTAGMYSLSWRTDSLPGTISTSREEESSGDVSRLFRVPESWGLGIKNDVRVRAGVQEKRDQTFVADAVTTARSRLADNGRINYNLTADTDLSQTMQFTLQASRLITFDNNLNHRFAQTVFSTLLTIQLFNGDLR